MTTWSLIRHIVKNETSLVLAITFVLLITGLTETVGLLFIAPIVDILTSAGVEESSSITKNLLKSIEALGFPAKLWFIFLIHILIKSFNALLRMFTFSVVKIIKIINIYSSLN